MGRLQISRLIFSEINRINELLHPWNYQKTLGVLMILRGRGIVNLLKFIESVVNSLNAKVTIM